MVGTIQKPVRVDEGGGLKVGNTRVSLDSVVYAFNRGEDADEIQRNFDMLSLAEVHAPIAYYLHNMTEVDEYLEQQRILVEKLGAENNAQEPVRGRRAEDRRRCQMSRWSSAITNGL